jgi:hypothetical protein
VRAYFKAKDAVINSGFEAEIAWQEQRRLDLVLESEFLREAAWVVLTSGFRESVVRGVFPELSCAFCEWASAEAITSEEQRCRRDALKIFGSHRKIDAILHTAKIVHSLGFPQVKERLLRAPMAFIRSLPFMGDITSFHLAKNLGVPVVKPDRHLVRAAQMSGFSSPGEMCGAIAQIVGDPVGVVDVVIWRYATLTSATASVFRC